MNFNIDILIVFGYMLFCLSIGLFKYGKIKNIRDYTLGSKPFPTAVLLATTFATAISARQIIGHVGKVYELGLIFIIPLFFIPISWLIFIKIVTPNLQTFRKYKFISLSDIMEHWYGKTGRWVCNIISVIRSIAATAMSAIAIGYLLHYFLNISEITGMMIGLIIVTGYSMFGGIVAVAFTDVFQFLIFFIALPVACFIGYQNVGGIENIWSSLSPKHIQIPSDKVVLFISFIFFALMPIADIPFIQRALIAKDKKQFLQSFVGVSILLIPLLIIVSLMGLITYHNTPGIVGSDKVLYHFVDHYLPVGMKGLLIAGLLAVIMSTQDSYLNTTSVLLSHDICKQIWSSLTNRQELLIARVSCIAIALASISIIFIKQDIIGIIWLVNNLTMPLITVPMVAGLMKAQINKKYFIFVVLLSLATISITRLFTGMFDTRSITVGIITSTVVLYILHRRHNNKPLKPYVKIPATFYLTRLNKISRTNSFSISSLYIIGGIIGFNFISGLIFLDLTHLNLFNCFFIATASLFLMLILNEFWHKSLKKLRIHIWKFALIFSLLFIPSYIMFSNNFHILWICNYVLSAVLFITLTSFAVGTAFILLATAGGYLISTIYINEVSLIKETAILSCFITTIAIIVQIYTRNYIAKQIHKQVTHQLEEKVQERTVKLQEALNVKNEFLNKVTHEVSAPLQGVIGITDVWHDLSEQDKKKHVNLIAESGHRLKSYILNILDLATAQQHKFNLDIKPGVDLIEIAKTEIHNAESFIKKQNKNLVIKLELKILKPVIIECDAKRISQVFHNLLHNAIKYSKHGEIKVLIDNMKESVKVSISDQGVGIPDNEKQKIFEPFFEGSRTKSTAEGKGLGLAMAQEIISMHQSNISIEDNKPRGTMFTFLLPYAIKLVERRVA